MNTNRYKAGTAIYLTATITDTTGALIDPTSVTVTIIDSSGTVKVAAATATKVSIGVYSYILQTAGAWITGMYKIDWTAVSGAYTSIEEDIDHFEIF